MVAKYIESCTPGTPPEFTEFLWSSLSCVQSAIIPALTARTEVTVKELMEHIGAAMFPHKDSALLYQVLALISDKWEQNSGVLPDEWASAFPVKSMQHVGSIISLRCQTTIRMIQDLYSGVLGGLGGAALNNLRSKIKDRVSGQSVSLEGFLG